MDKITIKNSITDLKAFLEELVAEGLLDGDQKTQILFNYTVQTINTAIAKDTAPTE